MMPERGWLRVLQVRESRHNGRGVACGQFQKRYLVRRGQRSWSTNKVMA